VALTTGVAGQGPAPPKPYRQRASETAESEQERVFCLVESELFLELRNQLLKDGPSALARRAYRARHQELAGYVFQELGLIDCEARPARGDGRSAGRV